MNAESKRIEQIARAQIRAKDTDLLICAIENLDKMPRSEDTILTRVWIIEELEIRQPTACHRWLDSNIDSPRSFFRH